MSAYSGLLFISFGDPVCFSEVPLLDDTESLLEPHLVIRNLDILPADGLGILATPTHIAVQVYDLGLPRQQFPLILFPLF